MEIQRFDSGLLQSNMYLVSEGGHAIVIDPARETKPGEGLTIDLLLITHEHYDHISGVNLWKEKFGAPLLCSKVCAERIADPRKNQARYFEVLYELQEVFPTDHLPEIDRKYSCRADRVFEEDCSFEWMGHQISLIQIPGHSPGSTGILIDQSDFFSGDSLLENAETELRFPGGSRSQWTEIGKPKIDAIPKGTRIRPGHFAEFYI